MKDNFVSHSIPKSFSELFTIEKHFKKLSTADGANLLDKQVAKIVNTITTAVK